MDTHTNTYDRLVLLKRELNSWATKNIPNVSDGLFMATQSKLEKLLGGREQRMIFYRWAFDDNMIDTSKMLNQWQRFALVRWAQPAKLVEPGPWTYERQFLDDCLVLRPNVQAHNA